MLLSRSDHTLHLLLLVCFDDHYEQINLVLEILLILALLLEQVLRIRDTVIFVVRFSYSTVASVFSFLYGTWAIIMTL
jgi:hypothetical protein